MYLKRNLNIWNNTYTTETSLLCGVPGGMLWRCWRTSTMSMEIYKMDLYMWEETNTRDLYIWKQTYTCEKRPIHETFAECWIAGVCQRCQKRPIKEICIHEKRPMYMKRDLHMRKETSTREIFFLCRRWQTEETRKNANYGKSYLQKRPIYMKRDL